MNNDGNIDIAVSHQHGTIYMEDGEGNFILANGNLPSPGLVGLSGISLGDVNNDGMDDLAYATSSGEIEVWFYMGDST